MSDCVVQGNQAKYSAGAIYVENSDVRLMNTYLIDNKAVVGGGAIYAEENSFLLMNNCTFHNNEVTFSNPTKAY